MTEETPAQMLHRLVMDQYRACGGPVEDFPDFIDPAWEVHRAGPEGVVAFGGDLYMVALEPSAGVGTRRAILRLIRRRLAERGVVRSTVYWRNWDSAMATKQLGAKLLGIDEDGYFHYELTRESFRYGQEKRTQDA